MEEEVSNPRAPVAHTLIDDTKRRDQLLLPPTPCSLYSAPPPPSPPSLFSQRRCPHLSLPDAAGWTVAFLLSQVHHGFLPLPIELAAVMEQRWEPAHIRRSTNPCHASISTRPPAWGLSDGRWSTVMTNERGWRRREEGGGRRCGEGEEAAEASGGKGAAAWRRIGASGERPVVAAADAMLSLLSATASTLVFAWVS